MSASHDEVSAMQVETDDFMLSLTSDDVNSNGPTEEITTHEEVTDLPPDLVNADVSELASNPALWLGLEGSLESNDAVAGLTTTVSSMDEGQQQMNESIAQLNDPSGNLLSHSEEVETMSIEAMEVDVHTSTEDSQTEEISSLPIDNFMEQASTDLGINVVASSSGTATKATSKEPTQLIPVTLSLQPVASEPAKPAKFALIQQQQRKTITGISGSPGTSQVTKVVLAPATGIGQQSSSSQPLVFTVPASSGGVTSLLSPSSNLRIVNTGGNKTLATVVASSSAGTGTSQPVRLMSPTKTITLQQAQQLGLITSPKKGQPLVVSKVSVASGSTSVVGTSTVAAGTLLAGKAGVQTAGGTKFAGGNVTLVRSVAAAPSSKTPAKIAPAPPQTTASSTTSNTSTSVPLQSPQQPTSLLIKNAAGQVTMATLVSARPSTGVTNLSGFSSPQKFVLRPATPGAVGSTQVRHGTQPAQYIRMTTAQALAAGILPASQGDGSGGTQQLHLAGNKIQLIRVVTPSGSGTNASTMSSTSTGGTGSPVVIGTPSATTVKLAMAGNSLTQHSTTVASTMVVTTPKTILTSTNKLGTPVKTTTAITCAQGAQGAQRILLPAGSIGSLSGTNLMVVPAQYVSQGNSGASSSSSTTVQSISLSTSTSTNSSLMSPVVSSSGTSGARSVQQQQQQQQQQKNVPVAATTASALSPENSKSQAVLESNGLKPRKPCNCTKSQCLKLYCDCFANGEFCHGCNCVSCANNLEHEELRLRAIRSCLDRNPHAFKPKIGVGWGAEPRRHNKGCHCKRSGCLKNYCECYEAKIACSDMCKCVGCKNCVDGIGSPGSAEKKNSAKMASSIMAGQSSSSLDGRTVSSGVVAHNIKVEDGGRGGDTPKGFASLTSSGTSRPPFSFITQEVVEATCQCLLAQAEEADRMGRSSVETEGMVLEEFGRCLLQIIEYASKAKGIQI